MDKIYNAVCFVIPNGAGYCHNFLLDSYKERYTRYCTDLCQQKGLIFDPDNDPLVQVWFGSDDLGSDNLEAHGFWAEDENYSFRYGYLPLPLIKDIKEGDTMDLEFEIEKEMVREGEKHKYIEYGEKDRIKLHITFDQRSYRYRNFGNFEDVVRKVVSHCVLPG